MVAKLRYPRVDDLWPAGNLVFGGIQAQKKAIKSC